MLFAHYPHSIQQTPESGQTKSRRVISTRYQVQTVVTTDVTLTLERRR